MDLDFVTVEFDVEVLPGILLRTVYRAIAINDVVIASTKEVYTVILL